MSHAKLCRAVVFAVAVALLLSSGTLAAKGASKKDKKDEYAVTEAELQGDLMSYADRYASIAAQAIDDVEQLQPPPEVRRQFAADLVYSAAAAYTIAADADAQIALLDMVVLGTLGPMVFEEYWRPKYGAVTDPVISALRKLEVDIWEIANRILDPEQQAELRERIEAFRAANPELTTFSHLRFADFPSKRATSTLKQKSGGGIFKSVRRITEQVEQTRMLAERGMYLSTRLPLLGGFFADIWLSRISFNPAVQDLLGDVHTFADVSERLATVAEQLPAQITEERNETIRQLALEFAEERAQTVDHVFEGIAAERKSAMEQLAAEEERLSGIFTELRQTLSAGNDLTLSVGALMDKLDLGPPADGTPAAQPVEPAKPFDIDDYRKTLVEAGATIRDLDNLVGTTHQLVDSRGADKLVPQLVASIDEVSKETRKIINHLFLLAALLIVIALAGYVIARLAYRWLAVRMLGSPE